MTFNQTVFLEGNTIVNTIQGVNTLTDGWFGILMFFFVYTVIYIAMGRTASPQEKLFVSGLFSLIIGILLLILNMINFAPFMFMVAWTIILLFYSMWE